MRLTKRFLNNLAISPMLSQPYRIGFYAISQCNRDGHAELAPGELRQLLGTGGAEATPQAVSKAIAGAKLLGLIGPGSSPKCLVVDDLNISQGTGRTGCRVHSLKLAG